MVRSPLTEFTPEVNFWDVAPQLKIREPFRSLHKNDKSRAKQNTSKLMWYIALLFDYKSAYYAMDLEHRVEILDRDWMQQEGFYDKNLEMIELYAGEYMKHCDTVAVRAARGWDSKMKERDTFIASTPYRHDEWEEDLDNPGKMKKVAGTATLLDNMMSKTDTLYENLEKILEKIKSDDLDLDERGGRPASESDLGKI